MKSLTVGKTWMAIALLSTLAGYGTINAATTSNSSSQQQYETRQNMIDAQLAPIRSREDLQAYLATTRSETSPFAALSLAAKQRFLASLRFSQKGLASFEYSDLEAELTPTQIYRVLSLFGVQRDTPLLRSAHVVTPLDKAILFNLGDPGSPHDHDGYECAGKGTCSRNLDDICTGNC